MSNFDRFSRNSGEHVKTLREAYARLPDLMAVAKKRGLEPELIHADEMENLAEEVMVQHRDDRSDEKVMEHQGTKLCQSFLYVPDLFCAPIFTRVSFQIS